MALEQPLLVHHLDHGSRPMKALEFLTLLYNTYPTLYIYHAYNELIFVFVFPRSSFEHGDTLNARQRMEEQFRQQQQVASNVPPQPVPEIKPVPGIW
jgi:hypothetical protein